MVQKLVLILEDDKDIREIIAIILSAEGYEIVQCGTVQEFYVILEKRVPNLFLLDIALPDGNGQEICRLLKEQSSTSAIPVLLMSAHIQQEAVDSNYDGFISKPFDIGELKAMVGQFAGRTSY